MSSEKGVFDENDAIRFIREYVGEKVSNKYEDDEILYVIDIIWDYYEKNGFLSLDMDVTEEEILDPDELTKYVKKELATNHELVMDSADIELIVKGDLEYEESLEDIF